MASSDYLITELIKAKSNFLELRNKVNESIDHIITALENHGYDTHGNNIKVARSLSVADVLADNKVWKDFPKAARSDQQILWLFENYFKKAEKLSEIQRRINNFNGREVRIDNVARRMKREGHLVAVKYNRSNKLNYWGLPQWLAEKNNDFHITYRPNENELPSVIYTTEVSR